MKIDQQIQNLKTVGTAGKGVGIFLLAASAIMLITAGAMVTAPDQGKATLTKIGMESAAQQCKSRVESMGFVYQPGDQTGNARVSMLSSETPSPMETLMARADSVVQSCPGMELTELCAGNECMGSRLVIDLGYQNEAS